MFNDARLVRCLFYVNEVLEASLIGIKAEKIKQIDFQLTEDMRSCVKLPGGDMTMSAIVEAINAVRPENMKKLKTSVVFDWLAQKGYIENRIINGKKQRYATKIAEQIGIYNDERQGREFKYSVVLHRECAQKYIMDNMSEIIESGRDLGEDIEN